jgi:excisionase family DNA binding protein
MTFSEFAAKNGLLWLRPKLVAKLMACSQEHVYDLAKSGRIPYIQDGRNIRFRPEDLDAYEQYAYGTQRKRRRRRYGTVQAYEQ